MLFRGDVGTEGGGADEGGQVADGFGKDFQAVVQVEGLIKEHVCNEGIMH